MIRRNDTIKVMEWDKTQVVFSQILVCNSYVKCLQPKSGENVFAGYPKVIVGYSSITLKPKVFVTKKVKFLKKKFFVKS